MISLSIEIDRPQSALEYLFEGVHNPEQIHRKIGIQLYDWTIRNFNSGGQNQTPPWKPLAESTLEQKRRLGYSEKPLFRTGHLRDSIAPFSDEKVAGVGARASFGVDYAEIHETGSEKVPNHPPQRAILPPVFVAKKIALEVYGNEIELLKQKVGLKT